MINQLLNMLHGDVNNIVLTIEKQANICSEIIEDTNKNSNNLSEKQVKLFFDSMYYLTIYEYLIKYGQKHLSGGLVDPRVILTSAIVNTKDELRNPNAKDRINKNNASILDIWKKYNNDNPFDKIIDYCLENDINPIAVIISFASIEKVEGILDII